jgi:hypothetical protein
MSDLQSPADWLFPSGYIRQLTQFKTWGATHLCRLGRSDDFNRRNNIRYRPTKFTDFFLSFGAVSQTVNTKSSWGGIGLRELIPTFASVTVRGSRPVSSPRFRFGAPPGRTVAAMGHVPILGPLWWSSARCALRHEILQRRNPKGWRSWPRCGQESPPKQSLSGALFRVI